MPSEIPYDFFDTPDPAELGFWVLVNSHEITTTNLPKIGVTTMTKLKLQTAGRPGLDYDNYVCVGSSGAATAGFRRFYFMKPKSAEAKEVPFREYYVEEQPPVWPAVLRRVTPQQDVNLPLSAALSNDTIANAARNYVTVDLIPPTPGGRILVREYLSPTQHDCPEPVGPVPTAVNWDIPGASDMYSCLHDDIYVPAVGEGGLIVVGIAARLMAVVGGGEFFPATEMKDWDVYTLSDGERPLPNGGWHRVERIAEPPEAPRVSTRDKL